MVHKGKGVDGSISYYVFSHVTLCLNVSVFARLSVC